MDKNSWLSVSLNRLMFKGRVTVTTYRNKCEILVTGDTKGLEIISDVCDIFKLPEVGRCDYYILF